MPDPQTETSLKGLPVHFGFDRFQFFILFLLITSDNEKDIMHRKDCTTENLSGRSGVMR